jgi:hypothetical protein
MSTDERKPNPNATIQLDQIDGALDQVQFDSAPQLPTSSRKPPPLPPVMPTASGAPPPAVAMPSAAPPPAKKLGAGMIVGFVALLAVAIGGGLYVGLHAPATAAAPTASAKAAPSAAPSVTAAAPTPSASASVQHFTLPTIE